MLSMLDYVMEYHNNGTSEDKDNIILAYEKWSEERYEDSPPSSPPPLRRVYTCGGTLHYCGHPECPDNTTR